MIVQISMVKEKGKIVNNNLLTLANFFEFDGIQDIRNKKSISKYLPVAMQQYHD